jgi:cation transport regulator ChaC
MKTKITPHANYYKALVRKTRAYGSCYLHAGLPASFEADGIAYTVTGYGRSLQSGGHKYKAYAHRDGKVVPTKAL